MSPQNTADASDFLSFENSQVIVCLRRTERLLQADTYKARLNQSVEFDATRSRDSDGPGTALTIEWDFDGDGTFDTPRSQKAIVQHRFKTRGNHRVAVRLTDADGASSTSAPVIISVGN